MNETPNTFRQLLLSSPVPLQRRFFKQLLASIAIALITIIFMICLRFWGCCVGLLIGLYVAYLGFDVIWGYADGKIICRKMVCIKAHRPLLKRERLVLIMRLAEGEPEDGEPIKKFYLPASKQEIALITLNTVMQIYYRPTNQLEIVAWEIVDYKAE